MLPIVGSTSELYQRRREFCSDDDGKDEKEYAFEMACSSIRYGNGVTREVGIDLINLKIKKTCVFTDKNVR